MSEIYDDGLPEESTQIVFYLKSPVILCTGVYLNGEFQIENHWSLKSEKPENVLMWDYRGQFS